MFGYTQLKSILGTDVALSQGMIDAINEWKLMLDGAAGWTSSDVQSLKIEQGICREFADTVLAEMETSISVPALDKIYKKQLTLLNEHLQDGLALAFFLFEIRCREDWQSLLLRISSYRSVWRQWQTN